MNRLDPQSRAFLDGAKAQSGPALEQMEVVQARVAMKAAYLANDIEFTAEVERDDFLIAGPLGEIPVRTYQPKSDRDTNRPIVVFFHGGGGVLGDLDCYENLCRYLCLHSGAVFLSVGYRLAPEHPFPAGLEDCDAALRWTAINAEKLGVQAEKLVVMGDSTGGNLAASVCHLARERGGPSIEGQVLLYPMLSLDKNPSFNSRRVYGNGDYFISQASIAWTVELYLAEEKQALLPEASPIYAQEFAGLPPALVITAGFDPLQDEGEAYANKLATAGVEAQYHCYASTFHGFISFAGSLARGREALGLIVGWLTTKFQN
jgi:acetyl esterase